MSRQYINIYVENGRIVSGIPRNLNGEISGFHLRLVDFKSRSLLIGEMLEVIYTAENEIEDVYNVRDTFFLEEVTKIILPKNKLKTGYNVIQFKVNGSKIGSFGVYFDGSTLDELETSEENSSSNGGEILKGIIEIFSGNRPISNPIESITFFYRDGDSKTVLIENGGINVDVGQKPIYKTRINLKHEKEEVETVENYLHIQDEPSSTWEIYHTLNKYPSVNILDSSGNEVSGSIEYISTSKLIIRFSGVFSGRATLN